MGGFLRRQSGAAANDIQLLTQRRAWRLAVIGCAVAFGSLGAVEGIADLCVDDDHSVLIATDDVETLARIQGLNKISRRGQNVADSR